MIKPPIDRFPLRYQDDQVRDALEHLRRRNELERQNGYLLRALLWMMAISWAVVILRSILAWAW